MDSHQRAAFQAAMEIHRKLCEQQGQGVEPLLPDFLWEECGRLIRQQAKAKRRGWTAAARWVRAELLREVADCRRRLDELCYELERDSAPPCVGSLNNIYHDILALEEEFVSVGIDREAATIRVETEDVVLDEVHLGPFEIVLDWNQLGEPQPYEVIALDPNPAASNEETTHPHVQSNRLCEGEGHVALQAALRQGRLLDFFVLVRQILTTYNSSSPYVDLENWGGIHCPDCGRLMDDEDRTCCVRCDTEICCECSLGCEACGDHHCAECIGKCPACGNYFCTGCLKECAVCEDQFCQECLTDGQCKPCRDSDEESQPLDTESQTAQPPDSGAQVHSVCLGETAISA